MSTKAEMRTEEVKPTYGMGLRHVQCLMLFLALVICFAMRANISMAIVSMTDPHNDKSFHWSVQIQSLILSSFFWGYVLLNIPAGELATRFGGKILIASSVGINSALSLLLPVASYYGGWQIVCACRVLQGLSQGLVYPSTHYLLGKWAPLEEKSRLGTFVYAGGQFGTALELMASGFISECWGWPFIFYSCGVVGAVWTVVWIFIGADTPQQSTMTSEKERFYIQTSLGQMGTPKKYTTPWKSIWTSVPFWSLLIAHCGQNWGYWTLMTEMPSYMSQVLGVNIKANGVMSALPYLTMYAMSFPLGYLSDLALRKKWFSITISRKISNSIGQFGPALFLFGLAYAPAGNVTAAVALLIITVGLNAGHYTGFLLVHIDMSQNFAGVMMGITNCIANVTGIIAPLVAGALLQDETNPTDWRKVFFVAIVVYTICNIVFIVFGSSERQEWDIISDTDVKKTAYGWGFRHVNALMLSLGMMICYAMRVCISLAIVSMTDSSKDNGGWQLVCACRVLQGLSQGFLFPTMHNLIGKWVPFQEKSSLGTFIYAGSQMGTAVQLIVAGYISEYWGWPAIFYSTGTLGAIWTMIYILIGADSPYTSKLISDKERFYIQSSLGHLGTPKKLKTPWKSIWTCVPFLSLVIAHCGQNWGFWTLMTEMPTYMAKVLGVDIKANGVMTAIPYMSMFLVSFPLGYLSDLALRKKWLSLTASRKFSNSIGHYGPAIALIGLSYVPGGDVIAVVALLTVAITLNAGHFTGYLLVHIDMSPNFAGQMMGITNFFANIMGIIAPLVAGVLLKDETNPNDWRKVFFLSSAIYILCNTFFVVFGTSEKQKWNEVPDFNNNNTDTDEEAQKKEDNPLDDTIRS